MEHERFKEWLHLSVYGELRGDEKARLEAHILSCDECRLECEELVRMLETITASGSGEPSEEALINARDNLSAALGKERPVGSTYGEPARRQPILTRWLRGLENSGRGGWFRGYRPALAGAAMLSLGFLVGYLTFGRVQPVPIQTPLTPAEGSYANVSNVHFLDADAGDGEVELLYDVVRPVRLKAAADDRRMRKLLAHAILNGGNPGVRLEAINVFEMGESTTPRAEVKQALLDALVADPNAGVRRRALEVLQQLPFDADIKNALIFVLAHDENPGLRVTAMNFLTAFAVDGDIPEKEYNDILDAGRLAD